MLRYLEEHGLLVPAATEAGYRQYGLLELNRLRALPRLAPAASGSTRRVAFARRLRREPEVRARLTPGSPRATTADPGRVEQRKHERLLAA